MVELDYLNIISTLGGLTYVLGALIYALPIPFRGVKQWGPRLIGDGVYIVFWSAVFSGVFGLANQILSDLGASWNSYMSFVSGTQQEYAAITTGLSALNGVLKDLFVNFAPLTLITTLLSITMTIWTVIYALSSLVQSDYSILASLGVLLIAVPFRISRSAGATLLSFSLTFYVGLPLLQDFLNLIQYGTPNPPSQNFIQGLGQALNSIANALSNPWAYLTQGAPSYLIEYTILAPITYIIILSAITADLADTIGGYSGKVPFDVTVVI